MKNADQEKLEGALASVSEARKAVALLHGAEDLVLAEHAVDMLEALERMKLKLQRLVSARFERGE